MKEKGKISAVVLVNDNKEVLLYLRDDNLEIPYPNHWSFIGGHIEKNETPLEALIRETMEEIGYKIDNPVYLGLFDDQVGHDVYFYKCYINKRIEDICLTEGQRLKYFSLDEILATKNMPEPIKKIVSINKEKIFN